MPQFTSFIAAPLLAPSVRARSTRSTSPLTPAPAVGRVAPRACAEEPQRPNDPTSLRTESEIRRNQPPKPMRRRRRRRDVDDAIDWDAMSSVPLVRSEASPESGEDYWMDLDESVRLSDPTVAPGSAATRRKPRREIDDKLKERLKQEVASPYTQNWILRVVVVVAALVLLVAIFGGEESVPIIRIPDL